MEILPLGGRELAPVAAAVAAWQRDPRHHVAFVGEDADLVAAELAAEPAWRERLVVATDGGRTVGAVLPAVDERMGRVWWFGPWGVDEEVRRAVLDTAAALVPPDVTEVEFGPDARNEAVAALAARDGCTARVASSVLVLDPLVAPAVPATAGVEIVQLVPGSAAAGAVATLHDLLFPSTHTTGEALVSAAGTDVLAALVGGRAVGYVATEVQPDGVGYVDFLGTDPDVRRRGVARALLGSALRRWADVGVRRADLTVRHDATGARALYLSLGFEEERVVVPWRRGFDLR